MTASDFPQSTVTDDTAATPPVSAGAQLRAVRQAQGISAEAMAASLHVPLSKLQALEDDRLEALPDVMFARALALALCRQLRIDAAPILACLPERDVSRLAARDERGIDSPLTRPSLLSSSGVPVLLQWLRLRPLWVGALALLGLAYAWTQWPAATPVAEQASVVQTPPAMEVSPVALPAVDASPGAARAVPVEAVPAAAVTGRTVVTPVQTVPVILAPNAPNAPTAAGEPAAR